MLTNTKILDAALNCIIYLNMNFLDEQQEFALIRVTGLIFLVLTPDKVNIHISIIKAKIYIRSS